MAETCEECGAPLAGDQRYCLECGRRRGGARVDYRHYMAAGSEPQQAPAQAPAAAPVDEEPENGRRDYAPLAAVGGIAVLGLMLLVGVLIGKGNGNDTASTPPSVIRVPAAESSTAAEPPPASGSSQNSGAGSSGGGQKKKAKQSGTGTGSATKASQGDLESLGAESGSNYEKQSKELPDEIATPGAPPPIDKSKAPGGGEGGAEVIK